MDKCIECVHFGAQEECNNPSGYGCDYGCTSTDDCNYEYCGYPDQDPFEETNNGTM